VRLEKNKDSEKNRRKGNSRKGQSGPFQYPDDEFPAA